MTQTALHWLIALAPVLALAGLFAWLDSFKLMSRWEMAGVLLAGVGAGLVAYPVSGVFLDSLPMGFSTYSRFAAPWIEEALKAAIVIALFALNRVGFKLDAAIQGFAIGAGFAVFENALFLFRFTDLDTGTWLVRGLGTAVMHGGTAAIMTTFTHELAEQAVQQRAAHQWRLNPLWFVPGYLVAVAIHTAFNQFPDEPMLAMLAVLASVPLALLAIFHFGAGEAHALLDEDHDEHVASHAALAAGRFPDTESGRRIAAFASAHAGGTLADPIRHYLEVHTWLVLEAERVLMQQGGSDERVTTGDARERFARLEALQTQLGPEALKQLRPLLPFTRNDLWEMSELRERLAR